MATIRKRGDKWQVQVRRKGASPMTRTFLVRKDAEEWARLTEVRVDRQDLPQDRRVLIGVTLGQLVERYRDTVTPGKKGRVVEHATLSKFLSHPLCRKQVGDITPSDFANYRDDRLKVIKPQSLKRQLGPLRNLFEIAKAEWGLPLAENPLKGLRLHAPDKARERRLQVGERAALFSALERSRNGIFRLVVEFALETAMRRGEILGIRRPHIDFVRRTLEIPVTKTGHSRAIPLTLRAIELLRQGEPGDRPFPISGHAVHLAWEHLVGRAGLNDLRFHDLRHEAISSLFDKGLTVPEVALISGHRDMRMLFRYSHATRANILRRLDALIPNS